MSEDAYQPDRVKAKRDQLILISGCSGSGKSTIMGELAARGFRVYHEPGRQIVKEQMSIGGDALPWGNADKFLEFILSRAMHQMIDAASHDGVAFFDRSVVEPYNHFVRHGLPVPAHVERAVKLYRYADPVFMAPPWPEIYRTDGERKHGLDTAIAEYEPLLKTFRKLGYEVAEIPRSSISERADFILARVKPQGR